MRPRSRDTSKSPARGSSLRLHGTIARDIGVRIVSGRIAPGRVLNGEIEASGNPFLASLESGVAAAVSSRAARRAKRQSGGSPRPRKTE